MQLANAFADLLLNANVSGRESETKTNIKTKKRKYLHNRGIQEVNQNNNNGAQHLLQAMVFQSNVDNAHRLN